MMPNKTIYVRDADLPLFEEAQAQFGASVSSMFAEFLRERVAKLAPEEARIIPLLNQIAEKRDAIRDEPGAPGFLEAEYGEAETYARKSLKSLRRGDIRKAKVLYWAANTYFERAERNARETREISEKVAGMLAEA